MKRVQITQAIESLLRASFGPEADLSSLVVFEFVAANMTPLRKRSGLYQNARFTESTMREMSDFLVKESVQLILNHNDQTMPVGRVFAGEVKDESLHTLVAISSVTQSALIADIDAGILDQVSVGILPARLLCSECNFDYLGDEASMDNYWDLTCNEGHVIGQDGVHVRMSGLSSWFEMSLVGMGAVVGAKTVTKDNSAFQPTANFQRLAASGVPETKLLCTNHVHQSKDDPMDLKEVLGQLTAATTSAAEANVKLSTSAAALTAMTTERDEANVKLAAANTRIAELEATAATPAEGPSQEDYDAVLAAMTDITTKALVALGEKEPTVPTDAKELVAKMTEAQTKLSAAIPVGPRSKGADNLNTQAAPVSMRAFTTSK